MYREPLWPTIKVPGLGSLSNIAFVLKGVEKCEVTGTIKPWLYQLEYIDDFQDEHQEDGF